MYAIVGALVWQQDCDCSSPNVSKCHYKSFLNVWYSTFEIWASAPSLQSMNELNCIWRGFPISLVNYCSRKIFLNHLLAEKQEIAISGAHPSPLLYLGLTTALRPSQSYQVVSFFWRQVRKYCSFHFTWFRYWVLEIGDGGDTQTVFWQSLCSRLGSTDLHFRLQWVHQRGKAVILKKGIGISDLYYSQKPMDPQIHSTIIFKMHTHT